GNLAAEGAQIRCPLFIDRQRPALGFRRRNSPSIRNTRPKQNTFWTVALGQLNLRQDLSICQLRFQSERDRAKCRRSMLDLDDLAVFKPAFRGREAEPQRVG